MGIPKAVPLMAVAVCIVDDTTVNAYPYEQIICWHFHDGTSHKATVEVCAPPFRNSMRQKWNQLLDLRLL